MDSHLDAQLQELVRLLNGDKQAVKRLMASAIERYPGHSAILYLDKVAYDLKRDRNAI